METTEHKKIKYLFCNKGELHQGEPLDHVCVDQTCTSNGLICSVCNYENHQKHLTIPLRMFILQINQKIKTTTSQVANVDDLLENMDNVQSSIMFTLKECVENLSKLIRKVEETLISQYKKFKEKIINQSFMGENMPKVIDNFLSGEISDIDYLNSQCRQLVDSCKVLPNNQIELDFRPEQILQSFKNAETEFVAKIKTLNNTVTNQFQQIENTLVQQATFPKGGKQTASSYTFSKTLKSDSITLDPKFKTATQTVNQNQDGRFAVVEQELDLTKKSYFGFNVKKLANWVGVGICLAKTLQTKKLLFDYNNLGHGSYLISCNGYSWSHSVKEDNVVSKSFKFIQGDIVLCEFDPVQKKLNFKNKKSQAKFSMDIDIPPNEAIHPCVNLCNVDEKVEIINYDSKESDFL